MRLNTAAVVASLTLAVGWIGDKPHLWFPITVLIASIIWLVVGRWTSSSKVGSNAAGSITLKLLFNLIGLWATFGQLGCIALIVWWMVR